MSIKIEKIKTYGWESAIRGMRNALNSWNISDSNWSWSHEDAELDGAVGRYFTQKYCVGEKDLTLMRKLARSGDDHGKFARMIHIDMDLTAPLYWWKEFDTYKMGTVANSCSTMHKIHSKEFTLDDFSHEHLYSRLGESYEAMDCLTDIIDCLNKYRTLYLETKDKTWWWQMIQLLPSSYNQKRTVSLNYQVAAHMYFARKSHKLDEWRQLCDVFESELPYFKEIYLEG